MAVLEPEDYDADKIEELLEQKRNWIYRNLVEWEDLNRTHIERKFISGEGFLYQGSNYRLMLVDGQEEDLILKNGYFLMRRDKVEWEMELFKNFYRTKGLAKVTAEVVIGVVVLNRRQATARPHSVRKPVKTA